MSFQVRIAKHALEKCIDAKLEGTAHKMWQPGYSLGMDKCDAVSKAQQVLNGLPSSGCSLLDCTDCTYAQKDHAEQALDFFEKMQHEAFLPNAHACFKALCVKSPRSRVADKMLPFYDEPLPCCHRIINVRGHCAWSPLLFELFPSQS